MTKLLPTIILSMVSFFTYGHEISQMDDVTLCKESILLDSIGTTIINDRPCATFYIHAQKDIKSHLRFRLMGGQYEDSTYTSYPLLIDNEDTEDSVVANTANWHDVGCVSNSPYFFSKGKHQITLVGSYGNVPNVEGIMFTDITSLSKAKGVGFSTEMPSNNPDLNSNRNSRYIAHHSISDSITPSYCFEAELNKGVAYTFYRTEYFLKGQTVNIRTDKLGNLHHTIYVYYANNPGLFSVSASSASSPGGHALLSVHVPIRGVYYIMVRSNTKDSIGHCNVTINDITYSNVLISCSSLTVNHAELGCQYASFALKKVGNPIIWQISGGPNEHVKAWNDDYSYDSSTSDFNWGTSARIDGTITNGDRILVASKNSNVSIVTDIYAGCKNVKSNSLFVDEVNLKSADVLASGCQDDTYNCIAWSVGEWTTYHEPGGLYIGSQTYEDFYAQYGLTPIGATESNSVVDLWGGVLPNGRKYLLHASVKAKSNPYSTGYDWESKAGAGDTYRIFHPRYSMKASYGEVLFHLRKDPSLNTLQYPVDYRVLAFASYNQSEKEQIRTGVNHISKQTLQDFTELFCRCEIAGERLVNATVDNYEQVKEYQDIFSICIKEPQLQYVLFQKLEDRSLLALKLLKDVVVLQNIGLAKDVIQQANQNKWTDEGKRIIRPIFTDAILFAKALLAQYRGEDNISYDSELVLSNSSRYDIQVEDHQATVTLDIPELSSVSIVCADLMGREINYILRNEALPEGLQTITFPMQRSGMYVVSVIIDGIVYERKINIK